MNKSNFNKVINKMCDHSNGWRPEDGVPDLAMMSDITDQGININLKTRYKRNEIYTFSGSILIAVNPYKQLNIYNEKWVKRYRDQKLDRTDPHVFALAESMYMSLVMQSPQNDNTNNNHEATNSKPDSVQQQQQQQSSSSSKVRTDGHMNKVHSLELGRKNQACVISGESGAGKTETTKFILSYLCSVTPNKSTWMEHQILEANTILEAFGNAKTVRNDNSSRFGKFIQICFDNRHQINGCIIQDYLLEQSRITYQSIEERNYHVFYQLLAAGQSNEELRKKFHLMPANFYNYLNKTQCYIIDGIDDCAMFNSLRTAMSVLNIEQESCDGLFSVISAILWLGNLQFECDEGSRNEQCHLTQNDQQIVDVVAELLGVERDKLEYTLLKRQINVRGSITEIPFRLPEARDNRNGMAKALYSRLFTWVVNFINASTNPGSENSCFMGILDIFGFENFGTNSFEQLCINYANEKLHKFFNHHMFAMEQELYQREGIKFCDINYTDNTACLELLERPPSCILRLLSEECRMPKGNDCSFVEKLHLEFSTVNPHPFYIKGNDRRNWSSEFAVRHFAGSVTYNVDGFLKKNKDSQQTQLFDMLENSSTYFLKDLIDCPSKSYQPTTVDRPSNRSRAFVRHESIDLNNCLPDDAAKAIVKLNRSFCGEGISNHIRRESSFGSTSSSFTNNSSKTRPTVADAFRQQLVSLVDLLNSVSPWYIRCIKPNLDKSATEYDDRQVLTQLKYLGMSDLIKIRREGYPIHLTKHQFVCRYRCLMLSSERTNPMNSPIKLNSEALDKYCTRIMNHFNLDPKDWRIGNTMVLLRTSVYQPMEERRKLLFIKMATMIQSFWRGFVQRRKYNRWRKAAIRIQETFRAFRGRLLFLRTKRATLTIQAFVRGMFAREIASALREIKRVEAEKARQAAIERERVIRMELEMKKNQQHLQRIKEKQEQSLQQPVCSNDVEIVVTEATKEFNGECEDTSRKQMLHEDIGTCSPSQPANISPAVSSSASLNGQEQDINNVLNDTTAGNGSISMRDRKEMEELVKVLERHGISLDNSNEKNGECIYTDFEKLYDVLGNQLHVNGEAQSISPSINEDDRCSMITTATSGCDGDSVSCSGQSQISSTITDDHPCTTNDDDNHISDRSITNNTGEDTVNQNQQEAAMQLSRENANYHSNSIESIASIMSTSSTQSANTGQVVTPTVVPQIMVPQTVIDTPAPPPPLPLPIVPVHESNNAGVIEKPIAVVDANQQIRTSTFTGSLVVAGSKMVSNGRPLTRIEEEPNSAATSPSKTPHRERNSTSRPQSLFPPVDPVIESEQVIAADAAKLETFAENKKRRLERKILQVQQEQQLIQPTTSGLIPTPKQVISSNETSPSQAKINQERLSDSTISKDVASAEQDSGSQESDNIYGAHKNSIIEYAESTFNNHPRDSSSGGNSSGNEGSGVIRTLTRRRKSIDTLGACDYLTKAEMLSYNPSHNIPTSHIKMHDPHNVQISCTLFRNLCKYMIGDNLKPDIETRIIQSIVRHGIEKTELRDEIYVQLIRQLTNNSNNEYCLRLWILLGLVTAAYSPSKTFSKYLINYLKSKPRKDPSITCHVQFCLENLQTPRINTRKYPPSPLEIQACKNLNNLTCKINLLDGRCISIGVHPCDTAIDTLTKLAHRIDLQSIEGWVLYESYTAGSSKYPHPTYEDGGDFERSVKAHSYMADILALWQDAILNKSGSTSVAVKLAQKRLDEGGFRLTLKKRVFRGPKIRNDPVEISLLYSQAVYNVVKRDNFLVDESLALSLAGLQAQVTLGNAEDMIKSEQQQNRKGKQIKVVSKQPSITYDIESYICQRVRHQTSRTKKEWSALILHSHKQFHGENEVFCKMRYLSMVIYHCPLYGTTTFNVTYKGYQTLDQNLMLGINSEGLVIIRASDRALISAYRYSDIASENGVLVYADEKIIQYSIKDRSDGAIKCMSFETDENEEIATLMISYSPTLRVNIRGSTSSASRFDFNLDQNNLNKKKPRLKMTLEDRMRTHQEVQNARRAIIRSGRLRKIVIEENPGILKHTLKRFSSTNRTSKDRSNRFDYIYGTLTKAGNQKSGNSSIPQTSSDYNIYGSNHRQQSANDGYQTTSGMTNNGCEDNEVAGATASKVSDESTKSYPHKYWAYTNSLLKNSLLTIYDPDLEEAALSNFRAILIYSGLLNYVAQDFGTSCNSTLDSSSIDSGIASQQSLGTIYSKNTNGSPSSISSNDLYDVCPKKMEERDLIKLAQSILDRCLKKDADILKNEFFLQLVKQTTDHPDPNNEINRRHWQLLALACSVTYPSDGKILAYLFAHLRRCSLDQVTDEGQYAQFTLKSLQGTLDTKGRRFAPSETEILSTINCRRVYARVYFLDGQFQAVEFDPCATIAEVVDQIKQKIGLKPECMGYALFQPLDDDCEQVLQPEEKVGDAIAAWESWHRQKPNKVESQAAINQQQQQQQQQQKSNQTQNNNLINKISLTQNTSPKARNHKFVFKKYLFIDSSTDLNDPIERELLYYQTVASIKEDKFPVFEHEAPILCAIKAQIEIGDYTKITNLPREHMRMIYKQVIISLMPPHAYNNLSIPAIAQQHQAFRDLSCTDTKKYFFNLIQTFGRAAYTNNPGHILLHQAHVYDATQTLSTAWPSDIWIVINQTGLHVLIAKKRTVLASCEYRQIVDFYSSNNCLMIIALTNTQNRIKYTFYTKQAQQIAQQMKDYTVMMSSGGTRRRKSVEFNLKQTPPKLEESKLAPTGVSQVHF